jgi:putative ABC transport system substrate-binding protein
MADSTRMLERLTFGILLRRLSGIFGFVFKLISDLRLLTSGLCALLFAVSGVAEAQQFVKLPRIGFLSGNSFSDNKARIEAFRQGLRELGYVEGKNIIIEWRSAEGNFDRLPALATELVSLKVDVIVSYGPTPTRVAKKATATVPIVMGFDGDPVGSGIVASLARPGGNITGLSSLAPEISGKQLEILKEIVPKLSRVAVLGNSDEPGNAYALKEMELAAGGLKVQLQYLDVLSRTHIETSFQAASEQRAGAVIVLAGPVMSPQRTEVVRLAAQNRLPAMYYRSDFVEAGGLMTYSTSFTDLFRRSATYVDKILKGAKPGDLPVEQPKKFEFIINLRAAKQIGVTIPANVLARADKVIK